MSRFFSILSLATMALASACENADVAGAPDPNPNTQLNLNPTSDKPDGPHELLDETQCPAPAALPPLTASPLPTEALIVHEWGTFTSLQGSDGVTLDGMHHEDERLPSFVHQIAVAGGSTMQSKGAGPLPAEVNQKMETPVLYFHTSKAHSVEAAVSFPKGVITQWFPDVASRNPKFNSVYEIANGQMTWQLQVDPLLSMKKAPAVAADSIWQPSRNVVATPVKVGNEIEGFVFYRGLGNFTLPLKVTSADGKLTVHNDSAQAIPGAVILHANADGRGHARALGPIPAGGTVTLAEPNVQCSDYVDTARVLLHKALVDTGLYDDEARAMIDTWTHSYFKTPGLRLLYILPPQWTDELLPLSITPTPAQTLRILVGRIEILTQQEEKSTIARIQTLQGQKEVLHVDVLREEGRFFEAKVRRALGQISDTAMLKFSHDLLDVMDKEDVVH